MHILIDSIGGILIIVINYGNVTPNLLPNIKIWNAWLTWDLNGSVEPP